MTPLPVLSSLAGIYFPSGATIQFKWREHLVVYEKRGDDWVGITITDSPPLPGFLTFPHASGPNRTPVPYEPPTEVGR